MTNYPNVVFIGQMRNGKTTSANWLISNFGYRRYSFAAKLKEVSAAMLTTFSQEVHRYPRVVTVEEMARRREDPEVRKIWQLIGSEVGRQYFDDEHVWVDVMEHALDQECGPVVIDDCRFANEEHLLKSRGFHFVRVVRPRFKDELFIEISNAKPWLKHEAVMDEIDRMLSHQSESYVPSIECDSSIEADTLDELYMKLANEFGGYFGRKE